MPFLLRCCVTIFDTACDMVLRFQECEEDVGHNTHTDINEKICCESEDSFSTREEVFTLNLNFLVNYE